MITALAIASTLLANSSGTLSLETCLDERIVLRDVTIADGSGRWSHQDILIEGGRFTAMGRELIIDSDEAVSELTMADLVVSPPVERNVIAIRASYEANTPVLMVGETADFSLSHADGLHLAEFRQGQPVGQCGL